MDKIKRKEGREVNAKDRIEMMHVKAKMVDVKLQKRREEMEKKEVKGCTFKPKIKKFKFQFEKEGGQGEQQDDGGNGEVFVDLISDEGEQRSLR